MILYLFELSGARTIIGYVKKDDLIDQENSLKGEMGGLEPCYMDIEDMEYIQIHYPAMLSMVAIPVNTSIASIGKGQEMTLAPTVIPYYVDAITVFISNLSAIAEIPAGSFYHEEMKRIIGHFKNIEQDKKKFTPHIVR